MVFSSAIFLFLFLPLVLLAHWLAGPRLRNSVLLIASLIFYAWGEGVYVLVMLGSIVMNYLFGLMLDSGFMQQRRRWLLAGMLSLNLLPLFYFKYFVFVLTNLNLAISDSSQFEIPDEIRLPIGISFFTFQAMSYLIDVYRKTNQAQRSVFGVGLYIALFPQLIAGPIVRYHDVSEQIKKRVQSMSLFASGVERFTFGLGKKMLIANPLGYFADTIFAFPPSELGFMTAWLGITCYALQIYFDFSGYSDMAIGLGRMFGFRFLENFNFPYISRSIRDFWRRWHMSLSGWFRDYLYIPLGGNRNGNWVTIRNLLLVFVICGLWHGASWNFVIWGLLHGLFLVLERGSWAARLERLPALIQHIYVLLMVITAWVFFRAETLDFSLHYLSVMYSWPDSFMVHPTVAIKLDKEFYTSLILGIVLATPAYSWLASQYNGLTAKCGQLSVNVAYVFKFLLLLSVFALAVMEIAIGSYNPFIYFRF
ncbi:MAG: MBOAT family O-acyltransferase [Arenicella sp.]